jgi:hypothetical protein
MDGVPLMERISDLARKDCVPRRSDRALVAVRRGDEKSRALHTFVEPRAQMQGEGK